jgi:drug/metabolite transporter (DMT)-like permease
MSPSTPAALDRRARLLMLLAPFCWSTSGLFVRSVELRDGWEIVVWRSLGAIAFVLGTLLAMHRGRAARVIVSVGRHGLVASLSLAAQFVLFILALTHTTVANVSALTSTMPLMAALAGALFLGETITARTWVALGVVAVGIGTMFAHSMGGGELLGNVLALCVPCFFALQVTMLKRAHLATDMLPTVMLAALWTVLACSWLAAPFEASGRDVAILLAMGCVQLGAGCLLMTAASRHLPAAEIGLVALLEAILAPTWVWLAMGEKPAPMVLAGGALVLAAVLANEALGAFSRPTAARRDAGRAPREVRFGSRAGE